MPGLGIVAQQNQGHAGHKPDILQSLAFTVIHESNPRFLSLAAFCQKTREEQKCQQDHNMVAIT
jgi:hypothetical protein